MSAVDKKSALLGQMSSLADFMFVDGRGAFEVLPDRTRDELRILFNTLNDELQELIAQSDRTSSRSHSAEDSSMEAV